MVYNSNYTIAIIIAILCFVLYTTEHSMYTAVIIYILSAVIVV